MAETILPVILVGLGMALAGRIAGWRIARREPTVALDSDSYEARVSWSSDVVALVGMDLSGVVVATLQLSRDDADHGVLAVSVLMSVVASSALAYMLARSSWLMNGYPESLIDRLPEAIHPSSRLLRYLPPGLLLSIAGQLALGVAALQ